MTVTPWDVTGDIAVWPWSCGCCSDWHGAPRTPGHHCGSCPDLGHQRRRRPPIQWTGDAVAALPPPPVTVTVISAPELPTGKEDAMNAATTSTAHIACRCRRDYIDLCGGQAARFGYWTKGAVEQDVCPDCLALEDEPCATCAALPLGRKALNVALSVWDDIVDPFMSLFRRSR
jgi:hypothetical protein